jgi:hypothetical protein
VRKTAKNLLNRRVNLVRQFHRIAVHNRRTRRAITVGNRRRFEPSTMRRGDDYRQIASAVFDVIVAPKIASAGGVRLRECIEREKNSSKNCDENFHDFYSSLNIFFSVKQFQSSTNRR